MRNLTDYLALRLFIFIATFIGMSFIAKTFLLAILYALSITLLLSIIIDIINKKKNRGSMSFSQFLEYSIINGNDYLLELIAKLLNLTDYTIKSNALTCNVNDANIMIIGALKFGNVSSDEVVKLHKTAIAEHVDELYLIARLLDRRSIAVANSFNDLKYIIISARRLYKLASKHHLIPKPTAQSHHTKSAVRTIISIALSRNLAPKYLLTAAVLGFMSIFTPLKTYYYVMTGIAMLLTVLSLSGISHNISPSKLGLFGKTPNLKKEQKHDGDNLTNNHPDT